MIFSLEALQAFHGDSLLLHAGTAAEPVLLLIDGGPSGTWETSLQPRLEELRAERAGDGALQIDLAMVSHIDSDHVAGMVDFAGELVTEQQDSQAAALRGRDAVAQLLRRRPRQRRRRPARGRRRGPVRRRSPTGWPTRSAPPGLAVVASVAEGRELRDQAADARLERQRAVRRAGRAAAGGRAHDHARPAEADRRLPARRAAREAARRVGQVARRSIPRPSPSPAAAQRRAATPRPTTCRASSCSPSAAARRMLLTGDARDDHVLARARRGRHRAGRQDPRRHPQAPPPRLDPQHARGVLRARHRRSLRHLGRRAPRQPRDRHADADRRQPRRRRLHDPPDQPRRHRRPRAAPRRVPRRQGAGRARRTA